MKPAYELNYTEQHLIAVVDYSIHIAYKAFFLLKSIIFIFLSFIPSIIITELYCKYYS